MNIPLTIDAVQKELVEGRFSVSELVDNYLDRISKYDEEINSFITVTDDYAKKKAKIADKQFTKNNKVLREKPLLGAVVALKDMYLKKGVRTTAGSKVLENYVPQYSSTVVQRLESSGAIIIGKTNQDAWAHGASGENSDYGATKNPWNKDYVPGGSSSGSAASLASNFATFSMGTDTGGSIRQPASFNHLVGFKPTYGAVSRYGVVAMASSLDTMGHFSHNVGDARKIFEIIRGVDKKDSTLVSKTDYLPVKNKYKLGVPKEYFVEGISANVKKAVEKAIKVYEDAGVEIVEVSLPHTKYAISVYYIIQPAEVSSNLGRYDGIRFANKRIAFGPEARRRIMLGTYVLSSGYYDAFYLKAMKVRTILIKEMDKVFGDVDALIAPVSPTPPFKLEEKSDDPLQMYLSDTLTVSANITGIPAISIPVDFTDNNLPVGFQLMGPRFSESVLFDLGEIYETETNWKPQAAIK